MKEFCNCGTVQEAMDAAEADHLRFMRSGDCVAWRLATLTSGVKLLGASFLRSEKLKDPMATDRDVKMAFAQLLVDVAIEMHPEFYDQLLNERVQRLEQQL